MTNQIKALYPNSIYNLDCLEGMKLIANASIDLILSDLPYGTTACSWDAVIPFEPLWAAYKRIVKPNGAIVLTASQPFTTALIASNMEWFKYTWAWVKTNCTGFANAKKQPLRCYEDVAVFYTKQPTYNPQGLVKLASPKIRTKKTGAFMGRTGFKDGYAQEFTNYPKNVLYIDSERSTVHSTQKPVALFEYLIRTYTDPGDLALDNCIGSGTTAIACLNSGRRFIGFELDQIYYTKSLDRISNHQAQAQDTFNSILSSDLLTSDILCESETL